MSYWSTACGQGYQHQTLLGATGTGKTFTVAKVVERIQRPTLVMCHNKTLAAQLYSEFREFFPHNAVEYFVSYYDYYQPEAYLPRTDTYIEKDADINEEIQKLRLAATEALMTRRDVIIVASVSAIYSLGSPEEYGREVVELRMGETRRRDSVLRHLVAIHYDRNDVAFKRGTFRVRGDTLDIFPAYRDTAMRVEFWGDMVERITEIDPLTGEILEERQAIQIYPAKHFVTRAEEMTEAIKNIEAELEERLAELRAQDKLLEAQRLEQRTLYDIEMMREIGYCSGIENYSLHLSHRKTGAAPWTLIDYFPDDYLLVLDESHMTVPQIRGMYNGDRARKEVLVEYGFRLPSALDNRPLQFHEFEERINQVIYTSATPGPYERQMSAQIVDQIIRPTGLVDPEVIIKPTKGQVDDLLGQIRTPDGAGRAGAGHDPDQADGRGSGGLSGRTGHQGSLPPLGDPDPGARRDPARPAPGRATTWWWASTCCARAWTCRRCRWWPSSMLTRRVSCALTRPSSRPSGERRGTSTAR